MRKTANVRAPRKPKGESAKVTIANLELQVRNLTARIAEVVQGRDAAYKDAEAAYKERNRLIGVHESYTRLQGWQDCARELLEIERTEIRVDGKSISQRIRESLT